MTQATIGINYLHQIIMMIKKDTNIGSIKMICKGFVNIKQYQYVKIQIQAHRPSIIKEGEVSLQNIKAYLGQPKLFRDLR